MVSQLEDTDIKWTLDTYVTTIPQGPSFTKFAELSSSQ